MPLLPVAVAVVVAVTVFCYDMRLGWGASLARDVPWKRNNPTKFDPSPSDPTNTTSLGFEISWAGAGEIEY